MAEGFEPEPSDAALWRSVAATLVHTVIPALSDPWARTAAIQLSGLALQAFELSSVVGETRVQRERDDELIRAYRGEVPQLGPEFGRGPEKVLQPGSDRWIRALERWLAERGRCRCVVSVQRIATGNSRGMWRVEADTGSFVVRIEQGGVFGTDGTLEAQRMMDLAGLGAPIAPVLEVEETGAVLGNAFFVMGFVENLVEKGDDRSLPESVAVDCVRTLHGLHQLTPPASWGAPMTAADALEHELARCERLYRAAAPEGIAALDEGLAWLRATLRPTRVACIVHGDPGPGNLLHDGTRVLAHTDWEFVHLGDPMEDWTYLISMRGARTMAADAWREIIRAHTGVEVTDEELRHWGAYNFFKGACANLSCLSAFEGPNPAPNMAIIGTALHRRFLRSMTALITSG